MATKMRLHAIVSGSVQGVSFRYYTVQTAEKLYLTGWVCNNRDRTVEVIAEGSQDNLEKLLAFLYEGSPHADVRDVQVTWYEATGDFTDFKVRYGADF